MIAHSMLEGLQEGMSGKAGILVWVEEWAEAESGGVKCDIGFVNQKTHEWDTSTRMRTGRRMREEVN